MANFKAVKFYRIIIGSFLLLAVSVYGEQPADNFRKADSLYRAVLDSVTGNWAPGRLRIEMQSRPDSLFIRSAWVQSRTVQAKPDSSDAVLVIDGFGVEVVYREEARNLLGWSADLKREVRLYVQGRVEQGDRVLKIFERNKSAVDLVSWSDIPRLEQGPFKFCKGRVQRASQWTRFIQPAVVIGAVSVIVYLFFSVRT